MATSKFLRYFQDNATGNPATGMTVWLVPQSVSSPSYPSDYLLCTEDGTRDGQYYRENVPDGEYKIYIDVAGGTTPSLYLENIWVGESRLTTIADHFDSADSYKLKTTGIKDSAITGEKLNLSLKTVTDVNTPAPDFIGQIGEDSNGFNYKAIDLVSNPKWKILTDASKIKRDSSDVDSDLTQAESDIFQNASDISTLQNQSQKFGTDGDIDYNISLNDNKITDLAEAENDTDGLSLAKGRSEMDKKDLSMRDTLYSVLPVNQEKGEGTQNNSLMNWNFVTGDLRGTYQLNDDGPFQNKLSYKRRMACVGTGTTFKNFLIDFPSTLPEVISFGFYVKKIDVENVYGLSDQMRFWIYEGGIIHQPNLPIRSMISEIGYKYTSSFNISGKMAGSFEAVSLKESSGYVFIVMKWYNITYDVSYSPTDFRFYFLYDNVETAFNGNHIDYCNFVFLFDAVIDFPFIYPDGVGSIQYPDNFTSLMDKVSDLDTNLLNITGKKLTLLKSGVYLYIRSEFDSTRDLVQKWKTSGSVVFGNNNPVTPWTTTLVSKTALNESSVFDAGTFIHTASDDACPANYNGTYIGANHGPASMIVVSSAIHGKTNEDVGSEWTDGSGRKFYILRVVDTNTLWVLSENIGSDSNKWDFDSSITGDLTHSQNATHTSIISVESQSNNQLEYCIKNVVRKIIIDGNAEISEDGIYYTSELDIIDEYDIINPVALIDYLVSNVGDSEAPDYSMAESQVYNNINYHINQNGSCVIYYHWLVNQEIDLGYMGFLQMERLYTGGSYTKRKQYMPKVLPISDGVKTWTLTDIEDMNSLPATALDFTSAYYETAGVPPDRMVQFLADSGDVLKIGFAMGYVPEIGISENRNDLVSKAWQIYTTGKHYPHGIDDKLGNLASGTYYNAIVYRQYFRPQFTGYENTSAFYTHKVGNFTYVYLDYHVEALLDKITLPVELNGKLVTVVEKTSNITLHSDFVSQSKILLSKSGSNYGYLVLKFV